MVLAFAKKNPVTFIFVTVMMDMLAFGIIIPVLPKIILTMSENNPARATYWNGLLGFAWAVMQFFSSPLLGALSDRYGRRPVILVSNFGLALDFALLAWAPSLWWLLVARLLSGAVSASVSTANAYISDVTAPAQRAKAFGILGAAFGIGFVLGPAFGGILGHYDPRLPFWGAAGLSLINGIYGWIVLPESLAPADRTAFSWAKANPIGSLTFLRENPRLLRYAWITAIAQLAHFSLPTIFVLYALVRYGWGPKEAGTLMTIVGLCSIVVQGFLVGRLVPRLGERRAAIIGYTCGALGLAIYGWAPSGTAFYLGIPIMSLWGLAGPSIQSIMTQHVGPDAQGKLQGMNGALMAMAGLIGPLLYNQALSYGYSAQSTHMLVGLPFYIAACLLLVCVGMAMAIPRPSLLIGSKVLP